MTEQLRDKGYLDAPAEKLGCEIMPQAVRITRDICSDADTVADVS